MSHYTIISDYDKQVKLKEIETECCRLKKPKYWVLKMMGVPKSTYYDWLKNGGTTKSKAPKTVWNKMPREIEELIIKIRNDSELYKSSRSPLGISQTLLRQHNILISPSGAYNVLKRNKENRKFVSGKKTFLIYPKSQKFLEVVCIDDVALTNWKPRELAVLGAVDEYSEELLAATFLQNRVRRTDIIDLLKKIKNEYGRYPRTVRLDNAKAHISLMVKDFCRDNGIKLQFIDPGTPQQNWPIESFNKIIQADLINTELWGGWRNFADKQKRLDDYRTYFNNRKPVPSDPLKRTPREIATGQTSIYTQKRLKIKLLRKYHGQVAARQATILKNPILLPIFCPKCA